MPGVGDVQPWMPASRPRGAFRCQPWPPYQANALPTKPARALSQRRRGCATRCAATRAASSVRSTTATPSSGRRTGVPGAKVPREQRAHEAFEARLMREMAPWRGLHPGRQVAADSGSGGRRTWTRQVGASACSRSPSLCPYAHVAKYTFRSSERNAEQVRARNRHNPLCVRLCAPLAPALHELRIRLRNCGVAWRGHTHASVWSRGASTCLIYSIYFTVTLSHSLPRSGGLSIHHLKQNRLGSEPSVGPSAAPPHEMRLIRFSPVRVSRPVRTALALAVALVTTAIAIVAYVTIGRTALAGEDAILTGFGDECRGWIPTDPQTDVMCPGASSRLREAQAFLRDPVYEYDESLYAAAQRLEACALGLIQCPDRPLVISLWPPAEAESSFFAEVERRAQLAWRDDVVSASRPPRPAPLLHADPRPMASDSSTTSSPPSTTVPARCTSYAPSAPTSTRCGWGSARRSSACRTPAVSRTTMSNPPTPPWCPTAQLCQTPRKGPLTFGG